MPLPDENRRMIEQCDDLIQQKLVFHKQLRAAIVTKDFDKIVEFMVENAVEDVRFFEMYGRNQGLADRPNDTNMEELRKILFYACKTFEI